MQEVHSLIHSCLATRLIIVLIVPDQFVLLGQLKLVTIRLDLERRQLLHLFHLIHLIQFPDE